MAQRAKVFGFTVMFYDPYKEEGIDKSLGIDRCQTLDDLLYQADCVSLHCPLTEHNRHMINEMTIGKMRPGTPLMHMHTRGICCCKVCKLMSLLNLMLLVRRISGEHG